MNGHDKISIESVLLFLSKLFDDGLGYVSVNAARSALSTIYGVVDGHPIGSHPLVVRLCKGVGRLRPPVCKYEETWDASIVLNLLRTWGDNASLSLMDLSMKCLALLALCSAQRMQTLRAILISNIELRDKEAVIKIPKRLKTSKVGHGLVLRFDAFKDKKLCVVNCLRVYLDRTSSIRNSDKLFVCTKAPFGEASAQTISNWAKRLFALAQIDVNKFSAHSFRHSSTSKAKSLGIPTDVIFSAAGWSKKSKVFAKFYDRPIHANVSYASGLLNGCK